MRVFAPFIVFIGVVAACGARQQPASVQSATAVAASSVTLPPAEKPEDKRPAEIRRYLIRFYALATRHKAVLKTFTIVDDFSGATGDMECETVRIATMLAAVRAGETNQEAVTLLANLGITLAGYQLEQGNEKPEAELNAYEQQLNALETRLSGLEHEHARFRRCSIPNLPPPPYKRVN